MDELGRIVVVAAGFALWKGGRCIAAARWADIRRITARRTESTTDALRLHVQLADETLLEFHEKAPGFDAFLDRASVTLAGLLTFAAWHPKLMLSPPAEAGFVIFERPAPRR
ncbi:MAG: hypothetical protein JWL61_4860 [Gemmatimonadetes bacterium]|nr:hypothetical protein [Gemmatimonadota bacterium]